jgi:hypothetical protein
MSNELTMARRKLQASTLVAPQSLPQALGILSALEGVSEAKAEASEKWIQVRYDVAKIQYPALIQALEAEGLLKRPGWREKLKRGWYADQDCVARDNARAKPSPCCSNPTSIMAQSGKKKHR